MKHLLIIGARGYGREVYNVATESIGFGVEFDVKGFLDDKTDALEGYNNYPPIISSVEVYEPKEDDVFICALGEVSYKKKYAEIIEKKNGTFISLIHKTAHVSNNTAIGRGCIIGYYANVSCDIKIGDFVTIQPFVEIGHDAVIGNYSHLNTYSFVGGYAIIGDYATVHTGAIVLPKMEIGKGATIGAGSVIIRKIPNETTTFSQPANILKLK